MNENRDHDQLFKTLIREFFAEFLWLFFAVWAERFDLEHVEWLDKEVLPNPPEGSRHLLDLVAKLRAKKPVADHDPNAAENWLVLIHIEIESADRTTAIKPRLPSYYIHLRDRFGLPVLPIVIYLKVGLDGVGVDVIEETFWELPVLIFRYLYVGLPGLEAVQYLESDNRLGVALSVLMKIPKDQIMDFGRRSLEKLTTFNITDQDLYLLAACVRYYIPLDVEDQKLFNRIVKGLSNERIQAMNKTLFEEGIEKGRELQRHASLVQVSERMLNKKFGPLEEGTLRRLRTLNADELENLAVAVITANSLGDLGLNS